VAKQVAVVGGGWAGCAAAVELTQAGHHVTLFEAARTLGGRARRVSTDRCDLDNGQHIMLGAYSESLRLMRHVGVDRRTALLSLPLQMRYVPGNGGMDFVAPRLPAPLHIGLALLRAKGLSREDKISLARFSTAARWMDWKLATDCSVAELMERFDQTARLVQLMWRPLCLAALNTAPERASANVFLAVLRDSLGARRAASDMLLPRADLSALFPDAAAKWLIERGATVRLGAKVAGVLRADGDSAAPGAAAADRRHWRIDASGSAVGGNWTSFYDAVVLAGSPVATSSLLQQHAETASLAAQLAAFEPEPITTCYLQYAPDVGLDLPFYALIDNPATRHWGQFVFDRRQLDTAQPGLLAVVISASSAAVEQGQEALVAAVAAQLAAVFGRPELAQPGWSKVITEKRATYASTPGLSRPANETALPGLVLAGDYTAGDYPATIEMAVRSGVSAAGALRTVLR
jgi:squalene-associated FAD-dependent desaturase